MNIKNITFDRRTCRPIYLISNRIFNYCLLHVILIGIYNNRLISGYLTCPDDWRQFDRKCYKIFNSVSSTFSAANSSCQLIGSQLASLPNKRVTDFVTTLLNETWSSQLCMNQVQWCQRSAPDSEERLCRRPPCLSLWVGLFKSVPCRTCSAADANNRAGWSWLDGSVYDATQTRWENSEPTGHQSYARFGVFNKSMTPYLGDKDQNSGYSFICSKDAPFVNLRPAPTSPDRQTTTPHRPTSTSISGTTRSSGSVPSTTTHDSNIWLKENRGLIIGLAVGLSVGFIVLVVAVIVIICLVRKNRSKPKTQPNAEANRSSKVEEADKSSEISPYGIYNPGQADSLFPYDTTADWQRQSMDSSSNGYSRIDNYNLSTTSIQEEDEGISPYGITPVNTTGTTPSGPAYATVVKSKKSGIYGMMDRVQKRFSSLPLYAVPDKSKKRKAQKSADTRPPVAQKPLPPVAHTLEKFNKRSKN